MMLVIGGYTEDSVYGGEKPYWDTSKLSRGLQTFVLQEDGGLQPTATAAAAADSARPNPSYISAHPAGRVVYSVCESSAVGMRGTPTDVVAHAVDRLTGELTLINRVVCGDGPCFATVDSSGKFLLVTNISDSDVCVFSIAPDFGVGPAVERQSVRSGFGLGRDAESNAHSGVLSPSNRLVVVSDLALAKIILYRFDSGTGSLDFHSAIDSGPFPASRARHLVFHPATLSQQGTGGNSSAGTIGRAYGMNQGKQGVDEGSVSVYHVHEHNLDGHQAEPVMELVDRVSTLPHGHTPCKESVGGAAIQVRCPVTTVVCVYACMVTVHTFAGMLASQLSQIDQRLMHLRSPPMVGTCTARTVATTQSPSSQSITISAMSAIVYRCWDTNRVVGRPLGTFRLTRAVNSCSQRIKTATQVSDREAERVMWVLKYRYFICRMTRARARVFVLCCASDV
jgi:hypothetical protein